MKKTLFILILGILVSCKKKPEILFVSAATGTVLLETNPDESRFHKPISYLPVNSPVKIEFSEARFLKANFEGKSGWIEKSNFSDAKNEFNRFINSMSIVKVFSKPNDTNTEVGILKNNEPIEILSSYNEDFNKYDSNIWYQINYNKKPAWIRQSQTGKSLIQYYYFINSYTGLNLRKEPNVKATIIKTIPFEGNGSVNFRDSKEYVIQKQKGFWMNVNYENHIGWIFSGFTLIGSDLEELKNGFEANSEKGFKNYLDKEYSLKELNNIEFQDFTKSFKINKIDLGNYEIYELTMPNKDECDGDFKERLIFKNKGENVYSLIDEGKSESIVKLNFPFQNSVTTQTHMCSCCCPWVVTRTYFLMKNKIKVLALDTSPISNSGNCLYGPVSGVEWGQSFKRKSDTELAGKIYYPNCDFEESQLKDIERDGGTIAGNGYKHTLQLKILFSPEKNFLEIDKIYDKDPTPDFEQIWNQSDLQIIKPN